MAATVVAVEVMAEVEVVAKVVAVEVMAEVEVVAKVVAVVKAAVEVAAVAGEAHTGCTPPS